MRLKRESTSGDVATVIRQEILRGRYAPGARLNEKELAEGLGVSRAPVREALERLSGEGLVEMFPYKGTFVVDLTPEDVHELYTMRQLLEKFAVQLLCQQGSSEALDELDQVLADLEDAVASGDEARIIELDMRFHETLCLATGFQRLHRCWRLMAGPLTLFFSQATPLFEGYEVVARHREIYDAIRIRDVDLATEHIDRHISEGADRVLGKNHHT